MSSERDTEILALIESLKGDINLARKHSLDHTARLLKIALLDVQMIAHSISDKELESLIDVLEEGSLSVELKYQRGRH